MRVACLWFYQEVSIEKIAELFLRFSPQIAIKNNKALFIEIGKCKKLYSEATFIARAQVILRRQKQHANIFIGSDITDALSCAKYQLDKIDDLPLEALVDFVDPFERDLVLRKSVHKLIDSFQDLGINTLAQFKRLPASELISRYGIIGRFCYQRVHQEDFINWPQWNPEEIIFEKKEFSYFEFYGELEPILFELKSQVDQIFARLFARRRKVTQLQIQIRCEKTSTHFDFLRTLHFDFFTPQASAKSTLRILKERLLREFERKPILSPIEEIQTTVLKAVPFEIGQKNIFNNDEEKFEHLHSIHNQLVEILGKENVFQAALTEDRRPEKSWKKIFDHPHEALSAPSQILHIIPERATYLCRYPIKIEVKAGHIYIKNKCYKILFWDNQIEKISGGWYEKPSVEIQNVFDRNYSFVEIEGRQKISVFETPDHQFYLHGYYG
jgi:hypothetical protein